LRVSHDWADEEGAIDRMPFTLLHLGSGLLLEGIAPSRISLTAFTLTQVAIDVEPGIALATSRWPLHAHMHSLLSGVAIGLAVAAVTPLGRRFVSRIPRSWHKVTETDLRRMPALWGGLLGGLTHILLDALIHSDVQPFWPFAVENPLFLPAGDLGLYAACMAAGLVGAILLWARSSRSKGAA
jgi:hypothetical protein